MHPKTALSSPPDPRGREKQRDTRGGGRKQSQPIVLPGEGKQQEMKGARIHGKGRGKLEEGAMQRGQSKGSRERRGGNARLVLVVILKGDKATDAMLVEGRCAMPVREGKGKAGEKVSLC